MDPLSRFVLGPRAVAPTCLRVHLAGRWGLSVEDRSSLTVIAVTAGRLIVEGQRVDAGQVAVVRGPEPFRVLSDEGAPVTIRINEQQRCETVAGESLELVWRRGVRSWGMPGACGTEFLIGVYTDHGASARALDAVLPRAIVAAPMGGASADLLAAELSGGGVGHEGLLTSLVGVLLVQSVRGWAAKNRAAARWLAAPDDPVVGPMLARIHEAPADGHTVATLAAAAHASRALASARFTSVVGRPVMAYLRSWRLAIAADLVADGALPLDAIAGEVGYGSGFALSTAFRREFGLSPSDYRRLRRDRA
ncbi:hypothetical protein BW730_12455 [Tessaracoccus aquimaris]|uniref:HTH araC/xylS-type domain-containing protein n=1 Tax=Tessaracoccus aquimaris TaxID=1332264 RepID=A0A1Q2CQ84_9ACTN|nr:AraC family transcriptional regulator [Tessaracoccus aquimaris]AQP48190.1 hypothetical protein BW730_12455 [Tessaracoccus aquimaris]